MAVLNKWINIDNETERTYHFGNANGITIRDPRALMISESSAGGHSHRLTTMSSDEGIYIPAGWIAISWKVRPGTSVFSF